MNAKNISINTGVLLIGAVLGGLIIHAVSPEAEIAPVEIIRNYNSSGKSSKEIIVGIAAESESPAIEQILAKGLQGNALSKYAATLLHYDGLNLEDFAAEADALEELNGIDKMLAQFFLFTAWGALDPEASMAYLSESDSLRGREGMMAKRSVYRSWSQEDPASAAAYLLEAGDTQVRMRGTGNTSSLSMIASAWAEQDPVAAFEWINSLDENNREEALSDYMRSLYSSNPDLALDQLNSLSVDDQTEAIKGLGAVWGGGDEDLQDEAFYAALQPFARENPYEAAELITQTEDSNPDKNRVIATIAYEVSGEDPAYALGLALEHMDGQQGRTVATVLGSWLRSDTDAAVVWLQNQPASETLNRTVEMISNSPHLDDSVKEKLRE